MGILAIHRTDHIISNRRPCPIGGGPCHPQTDPLPPPPKTNTLPLPPSHDGVLWQPSAKRFRSAASHFEVLCCFRIPHRFRHVFSCLHDGIYVHHLSCLHVGASVPDSSDWSAAIVDTTGHPEPKVRQVGQGSV